jgi:hypothetical protein
VYGLRSLADKNAEQQKEDKGNNAMSLGKQVYNETESPEHRTLYALLS